MFFLASTHTKNTKSEKTNKHTILQIYPKKRFEHMLLLKVIFIAFAHKKKVLIIKTAKAYMCILIIYKLFYVGVCGVIIYFKNPFKQMPVNTRR